MITRIRRCLKQGCFWASIVIPILAISLKATIRLKDDSGPRVVFSILGNNEGDVTFESSVKDYLPSIRHDAPVNEFEVGLHSGELVLRQTDLFVPGSMPLALTRTWHDSEAFPTAFGTGTNHPYNIYPTGSEGPNLYADFAIVLEDGVAVPFPRISGGTGYANAVFRHDETASDFRGSQLSWNGNGWTLHFNDGSVVVFPDSYQGKSSWWGAPTEIRDARGHRIRFERDAARMITSLLGPTGHGIAFQYDRYGRIIVANDDSGNVRRYAYDSTGHLATVADAYRVLYRFSYKALLDQPPFDSYLMTRITGAGDKVLLDISYQYGRVVATKLADGSLYRYDYNWGTGNRSALIVTPKQRFLDWLSVV